MNNYIEDIDNNDIYIENEIDIENSLGYSDNILKEKDDENL